MGRLRDAITEAAEAVEGALENVLMTRRENPALVPVQVYASSGAGPLKEQRREQLKASEHEEHQWPPEPEARKGWSIPKPEEIPQPTYWPIVMSVAITFIFWGIITTLVVSAVGLVLFVLSLAGWIGDIRRENAQH